jgi:hypothetical protein
MAIVQIGVIVAAGMLARRILRLADRVEREVTPLFGHLNAIGRDASRATALAALQVERADKMFSDLAARVEQTMTILQTSIRAPVREGRALVGAFRAALRALREMRAARSRQSRAEDDDALFI